MRDEKGQKVYCLGQMASGGGLFVVLAAFQATSDALFVGTRSPAVSCLDSFKSYPSNGGFALEEKSMLDTKRVPTSCRLSCACKIGYRNF